MLPVESVIPDAPGIGFLWRVFSLRLPFLSGVRGSWQEVAYMLPNPPRGREAPDPSGAGPPPGPAAAAAEACVRRARAAFVYAALT